LPRVTSMPELLKGGQGREPDEVEFSGWVCAACVAGMIMVVLVALVVRWAVR